MAKGGSQWPKLIPDSLLAEAKRQASMLRQRTFLDPESSDNLVWALTVEQLRRLLCDDSLSPFVFELTGLPRRDLERQLEQLRVIRNLVAHNRATNRVALEHFRLVKSRLEPAIDHFKLSVVYLPDLEASMPTARTDAVERFFRESGLAAGRWFIVMDKGRFFEFGTVAGDPLVTGGFVDVGNLLDHFHDIRQAVLAMILPLPTSESYGEELSVVWPVDVSREELAGIRDCCLTIACETDTAYEDQDPKHICDPLVWFEGGRRGKIAAGGTEEDETAAFLDALEREDESDERPLDESDDAPPA